jgi:hypothetical protein
MGRRRLWIVAAALLITHGAARAQTGYTITPIVKHGDKLGDLTVQAPLGVVGISDSGEVMIARRITAGGNLLMRYADGKLSPLVVAGQDAPLGKWSPSALFNTSIGMSPLGSVAFSLETLVAGQKTYGTFLWSPRTQSFSVVARAGMPAADARAFANSFFGHTAVNRSDEVAFGASVASGTGPSVWGIFFQGRDGRLTPVALPGDVLPDGVRIRQTGFGANSLTDAGVLSFGVERDGDPRLARSAYLWESGNLSPVAVVGQAAPGGDRIATVGGVLANNRDRTLLVLLHLRQAPNRVGLYRFTEGRLVPLAVPGQEMPGGGRLRSVALISTNSGLSAYFSISQASEAGEHAFLAQLEDGTLAAYRLDPAGMFSLILKSGTSTERGTITLIQDVAGHPPAINSKGQVALSARFDRGPEMVVLLTPTAP